ncbi:TRAP transporter substrate-binding protein [Robertmurraya massiliosenegalensis]|uniref:TRAP transporter substrate-binding protein n=1 Tax=Robertmurraya TaxID=2837507 RepID=UPI0039A599BA
MKKFILILGISILTLFGCSNDSSGGNETEDAQTIILTHALSEDTTNQAGALAFKEYVENNSDGKLKVEVYPNSQLGGDREQLEGVQEGSITAALTGSAVQVNFVKSASILDLPFAFSSVEDIMATYRDETLFNALSEEYSSAGFKLLGISITDFRNLTSNKLIRKPEDINGLKIRTMESEYHIEAWKALGANPTPMPVNELYTALQQNTVDGQENPLEVIYAQKFHEQQKYITLTRHVPHPLVWVMNKEFYEGLSEELQTVVDEAMDKALVAAQDYQDENTEKIEAELETAGVEIIELTDEELASFADKTRPVWDMIKSDIPSNVYDAFLKTLE